MLKLLTLYLCFFYMYISKINCAFRKLKYRPNLRQTTIIISYLKVPCSIYILNCSLTGSASTYHRTKSFNKVDWKIDKIVIGKLICELSLITHVGTTLCSYYIFSSYELEFVSRKSLDFVHQHSYISSK